MPDITIGMSETGCTPNNNYKKHFYTVWHELFHASHFSQAGEGVWGPYINYIVTQGFDYGDGTAKETVGKSICELGESWAYAYQEYSSKTLVSGYWFDASIKSIYTLLNKGVLSRKQIYDCLPKDVKSINGLKQKMIEQYPDKKTQINDAF